MAVRAMVHLQQTIGVDLFYSFVIVFTSLLIYYATKELFELSNHKGIKYFRQAFIFFALAYAFRFLTQWLFVLLELPRKLQIHPQSIGVIALILFLYASTTAIFYLWASVHWRKIEKKKWAIPLLHLIAIAITIFSILTQHLLILLTIQFIIMVFLAITIYRKKQKNSPQIHVVYILLAVFWMLNILDILIPNVFQTAQIIIYLLSTSLFLVMLYKVVKKTGAR